MRSEERVGLFLALFLGAGFSALGLRLEAGPWGLAVGALVSVAGGALALRPWLRRRKALAGPFPEAWRAILERHVHFYSHLDEEGRRRFERILQRLMAEFVFEGVEGAEVTDEVRVLALAGGAVLLYGMPGVRLQAIRDIVIYPDAFDEDYDVETHGTIAGMVHRQGPLLFSAKALREGWARDHDGYNVALHEFAHVLDLADGYADGVPAMVADPDAWDPVITEALERVRAGRSKLREYAGTNRAELFAVAVETFFEQPRALLRAHPDLYEELRRYFGVDPLAMGGDARSVGGAERPQRRKRAKPRKRGKKRR